MMKKVWPVAVAGIAAGLLAPAGAAQASGGPPQRVTETSVFDAQPVKQVTASCPGSALYAGGGVVNYPKGGGGGVALTGIVPQDDGASVTVTATAPPGRTGNWSVTAIAICQYSMVPGQITVSGVGTATAKCPDPNGLFGVGFRVAGAPEDGHVREVALDPDLTRVRVTAGGPAAGQTKVTAIALCRPRAFQWQRARTETRVAGWPKTVTREDTDPELSAYAVGATVTGPPTATLDAIVPGPDGGTTWARGTLLDASTKPDAARLTGGDDGSEAMDTALIGDFY